MGESTFAAFEGKLRQRNSGITHDEIIWAAFEKVRPMADRMLLFTHALYAFNTGRPHFEIARESQRRELEEYMRGGITHVEILGGECPACKSLPKRKLEIGEALATMPLPCKECTTFTEDDEPQLRRPGWCRCCYVAHVEGSPPRAYSASRSVSTVPCSSPAPVVSGKQRAAGLGCLLGVGVVVLAPAVCFAQRYIAVQPIIEVASAASPASLTAETQSQRTSSRAMLAASRRLHHPQFKLGLRAGIGAPWNLPRPSVQSPLACSGAVQPAERETVTLRRPTGWF
jgi:hypothetical protein